MSRRKAIRAHYEPRISRGRENHDVVNWASARSQRARFKVLADNVPLEGFSLLDVGCGLGDLLGYLNRRRVSVEYTGVDLLEKMIEAAVERYPAGRFLAADIFEDNPFEPASFDVVFCSGVFNLDLGNNRLFLPRALDVFFRLARRYLVFNLLHSRLPHDDHRYFHFDPREIAEHLSRRRGSVRIIDDYLPNDFTVICALNTAEKPADASHA